MTFYCTWFFKKRETKKKEEDWITAFWHKTGPNRLNPSANFSESRLKRAVSKIICEDGLDQTVSGLFYLKNNNNNKKKTNTYHHHNSFRCSITSGD